jgi:hypothetical protein
MQDQNPELSDAAAFAKGVGPAPFFSEKNGS